MALILTNEIQKQIRFSVPVNNLKYFNTPEIHINQIPWDIRIRKAKIENRDVINVSLVCCYRGTLNENWSIEGGGKIKLVSFGKNKYSIEKTIALSTFDAEENVVSIEDFVTGDDLYNEEKEFIKNQALRFHALITTSPLKEQIESQFFDVTSAKFGVIVRDIKNLNKISSERVKLCGVEWFVEFSKDEEKFSVFLYHDIKKDDFFWAFNVDFSAKLLPYNKDFDPVAKDFKRCFSFACLDWGWKEFIGTEKVLDSKNGYHDGSHNIFFEISIDVEPRQPIWKTEIGLLKNDSSSSKMECPICFNLFANQQVVTTICGHLYCGDCIKTAIANNPLCPMCKAEALTKHLRVVHLRT